MDHARHMSSPSPTSQFLFHHSESTAKPFKTSSNPLTPLLSSTPSTLETTGDITANIIDDCFPMVEEQAITTGRTSSSNAAAAAATTISPKTHQENDSLQTNAISHNNNYQIHNNHLRHHHRNRGNLPGVDDNNVDDDDDDDDDINSMHNMLSGSSSSSTSTMPLLTESHSHHSFSRISLEEYSPLSLVGDCDNQLPISPTSLACGSHHSFKSSLNGLKIDNLVGDDHDDDEDDVVVNNADARSMSPTLLSAVSLAHNSHHNLWSNSSTAITQNTSLLNSASTSLLMAQHHQQQLHSLMQQLEPQSLDEPPPLLNNGATSFGDLNPIQNSLRPSSEPPPDIEISGEVDLGTNKKTPESKPRSNGTSKSTNLGISANNPSSVSNNNRSRKSRSRLAPAKTNVRSGNGTTSFNNFEKSKSSNSTVNTAYQQTSHCSKLHLQLNHHKKLQELQQRLFGGESGAVSSLAKANEIDSDKTNNSTGKNTRSSSKQIRSSKHHSSRGKNDQATPDSSAGAGGSRTSECIGPATRSTSRTNGKSSRQTRARTNRNSSKAETCNPTSSSSSLSTSSTSVSLSLSSSSSSSSSSNNCSQPQSKQKIVKTEKAEPDTTTKSTDCVKLADLLTSGKGGENKNRSSAGAALGSFILNGFNTFDAETATRVSDNGEKISSKIQQIQLQVNPSLTVVANGGLIQPINIQQQSQQGSTTTAGILTSNSTQSGSFTANQILCRSQQGTAVLAANGQLKNTLSNANSSSYNNNHINGEVIKGMAVSDALITNWSPSASQQQSGGLNQSNGTSSNNHPIGAHQIAIQVICQDGTSLVLPVSSAAGLNAAVSLTSQHQQLQAVLQATNGTNQQRTNNPSSQLLPLMSVSNIVAQQQTGESNESQSTGSMSQTNSTSTGSAPSSQSNTSGLAASSPTLAALLDAGSSSRTIGNNSDNSANNSFSQQKFVSKNLLRKLVGGNVSTELKRNIGDLNIQQNQTTTVNLANCGPLVTVCTTTPNGVVQSSKSSVANRGAKRAKIDQNSDSSIQATFTFIDPQGLVVANNNRDTKTNTNGNKSAIGDVNSNHVTTNTRSNASDTNITPSKQTKVGSSSTGNRQVDPTQPFRCEHCNSTFTRLGNFTRHKKIHTVPTKDGQRFQCDVCSKSFLQRCDLARHLHIHRGTEPHRCNICGKGYIRHSDLVTHQRFHNKEKPFGCPHCSKGFCQRGDLNRHLRSIHLQMKPILCPCCNKKFAKQETLLRHLNTAHRSKPGNSSTNSGAISTNPVSNEFPINSLSTTTAPEDETNKTAIPVLANTTALNNNGNASIDAVAQNKGQQVASLQAIQATLCKTAQSSNSSLTASPPNEKSDEAKTAKVAA